MNRLTKKEYSNNVILFLPMQRYQKNINPHEILSEQNEESSAVIIKEDYKCRKMSSKKSKGNDKKKRHDIDNISLEDVDTTLD